MIRIAVVDDEPLAVEKIVSIAEERLRDSPSQCSIESFNGPMHFLRHLGGGFDLLLIDLEMPQMSGFELSEKIRETDRDIPIVYITNRNDLVYDAFRYKAVGFIRKEHLEEELPGLLARVIDDIERERNEVTLDTAGGVYKLSLNEIVYLSSENHGTVLHIDGREDLNLRMPLSAFISDNPLSGFISTGVSYYVNSRYIYSIEKDMLVLKNGEKLYVPRRRVKDVKLEFLKLMRGSGI